MSSSSVIPPVRPNITYAKPNAKAVLPNALVQFDFKIFYFNDFQFKDRPKSVRPTEVDSEAVRKLVEEDPRLSSRYISSTLRCSHTSVLHSLHSLGKFLKLEIWVPHSLKLQSKGKRLEICTFFLSKKRRFDWLDQFTTGDEKLVLYVNYT